ncbi:MAG: undecaprenyldiphospho-muramoylpentapeptide beta-N-acetylglucosaminyltransferase [Bacteroidetes bacterium]|jgi:UDP-N-acetylglucosamine--N-acetylmuramyl-(pentapeptide) pyrophosphoryl-undecaprenol N-acetylglucosamine transferase|nr:undecaprenyldiphospho-muramoylpentapeptide beta-N-acetylglucosaminyltransferase [Bacteroidota bacterium]
MKIMISGGGTGGHVFPAIAIATGLKEAYPAMDIHFVGAKGKMEMEKVPQSGFGITGLPIRGLQRRLTLKNLSVPFRLAYSLWLCFRLLKNHKPKFVIGVGGYASAPLLWMAVRMNIPIFIQEQNSFPGITNRWLGKSAEKIFVAFPNMDTYFPADRIVFSGNPIRAMLKESQLEKQESLRFFDLGLNSTLLVFGGSLGAKTLNEAMMASAPLLRQNPTLQVLWQCGHVHYDHCKESEVAQLPQVKLMPFIWDMGKAYAAADVVICRAGALTISELSALGKAAVLVPSPYVAADHQTKNAKALSDQNAAILIPDQVGRTAVQKAIELIKNPDRLNQLQENISSFDRSDAIKTIIRELEPWMV